MRISNFKLSGLAIIVAFVCFAGQAVRASSVYFSYTDSAGLVASGSLNVVEVSTGIYSATSGTLDVLVAPDLPFMVGQQYPLLSNPNSPGTSYSPSGAFIYDDLLYDPPVGGLYLDTWGLLFSDGAAEINIWGNSGPPITYSGWRFESGGYSYSNDNGNFAVVPLAPPAQMGFAILACMGLAAIHRKLATRTA